MIWLSDLLCATATSELNMIIFVKNIIYFLKASLLIFYFSWV